MKEVRRRFIKLRQFIRPLIANFTRKVGNYLVKSSKSFCKRLKIKAFEKAWMKSLLKIKTSSESCHKKTTANFMSFTKTVICQRGNKTYRRVSFLVFLVIEDCQLMISESIVFIPRFVKLIEQSTYLLSLFLLWQSSSSSLSANLKTAKDMKKQFREVAFDKYYS